ncbi:DUF3892 domain-containing protein [Cystobacter fuscus]|uniref:DUF3892 domain-containing protein n=1 Tax=Cystobacter fuscus TaxID=43 RepID=UPI002B31F8B5|nr:DUF3892 domain-containing protein [Cystobacter fuscus]
MATKWADYVVTAIRLNRAGTRIIALEVRLHDGFRLFEREAWSFEQVAQALLEGWTFVTATRGADRKWYKGARVELLLRTHPDATEEDNLTNLPTF